MDQDNFHQFVRKTAHDVRTPITTIAGFADLLAGDKTLTDASRDMAATIVTETRRLSEMLESFFGEITVKPEADQ